MKKIALGMLLIIILSSLLSCFNKNSESTSGNLGNSMLNVRKGGQIVRDKNWTFAVVQGFPLVFKKQKVIDVYLEDSKAFKIFKWQDGIGELIDLNITINAIAISYLNVSGNHLYFVMNRVSDMGHFDGGLFRCDLNGNQLEKIKNGMFEPFIIDGNWIYYQTGTGEEAVLMKMRLDGSEKTTILDTGNKNETYYTINQFFLQGEWIYFIAGKKFTPFEGVIKRVKIDGTQKPELVLDNEKAGISPVLEYSIIDGSIYLKDFQGTYQSSWDGKSVVAFANFGAHPEMEIQNQKIYYKEGDLLFRADLDWKNAVKLSNEKIESFYLFGNTIYAYSNGYTKLIRINEDNLNVISVLEKPYKLWADKPA
ncbi:MAG: DUF5050 domain-containing protein [Clostridia bacterium]